MKRIITIATIVIAIVMSLSFTSRAYTEEEKAQAKAWLSAHGYSPDWGGANLAYQDYLNGKFDEELGVDVNGDGIPATTQATTEGSSEATTEEGTDSTTEESSEEDAEKDAGGETEEVSQSDAGDIEDDTTQEDDAKSGTNQEGISEIEEETTELISKADELEELDSKGDSMTDSVYLEGYQIAMIAVIIMMALVLVVRLHKNRKH